MERTIDSEARGQEYRLLSTERGVYIQDGFRSSVWIEAGEIDAVVEFLQTVQTEMDAETEDDSATGETVLIPPEISYSLQMALSAALRLSDIERDGNILSDDELRRARMWVTEHRREDA